MALPDSPFCRCATSVPLFVTCSDISPRRGENLSRPSRILFDVLAVFIERRRTDTMELTARQHRLQKIACVHGAFGLARAYDGVQLIDEEDDLALRLLDFVQHRFQPFLKFAAVFRTGNERAHIEGEDRLVLQTVRNIAAHDPLCQTFRDCRFADTGFADEHRVVLRFTRQDPNHAADLGVTTDHRIQLLLSGAFYKIAAVFLEHIVGILGIVARNRRGLYLGKLIRKRLFGYAIPCTDLLYGTTALCKESKHDVFDGDVLILHTVRCFFRKPQYRGYFARRIQLAVAAADLGKAFDGGIDLAEHCPHNIGVAGFLSDTVDEGADQTAFHGEQCREQMLRRQGLIAMIARQILGFIDGFYGFLCEFFCVHIGFSSFLRIYLLYKLCLLQQHPSSRKIRGVHIRECRGICTADTCLEHFIDETDVIGDGLGNLLRIQRRIVRTVLLHRIGQCACEAGVVHGVCHIHRQ